MNWNYENNRLSQAMLDADRLEEFLHTLGCEVTGSKQRLRGRCPIHLGDGNNFEVRTEGHNLPIYWKCFSQNCHEKKKLKNNLIGLVRGALAQDPDRPEDIFVARKYIIDFLGNDAQRTYTWSPRPVQKPATPTLDLTREQVRQRLQIPSPYFLSRGFTPEILDRFDIGESALLRRAVVPIYDDTGERCVGITSRSVDPTCEKCRHCHPVQAACNYTQRRWDVMNGFSRSEWLYNYAAARASDLHYVLLVEGAPDVLRAAEAGFPAVALLGSSLTAPQTKKLAALHKQIIIALDRDNAGLSASRAVMSRLMDSNVSSLIHPPIGFKDVGEMSVPEVAKWMYPALNPRPIVNKRTLASPRYRPLQSQGQIVDSAELDLSP